jgi:hypothetical protein
MSNIDLDQLKRTCGELGEVVIDPGAWPRVMDHLSKAVGVDRSPVVAKRQPNS